MKSLVLPTHCSKKPGDHICSLGVSLSIHIFVRNIKLTAINCQVSKLRFWVLSILLCLFAFCSAQDVTLLSQADVDSFDPSSTLITGDLLIGDVVQSDIHDLSNLSNLSSIGGILWIRNVSVSNLNSLSNLTSIGGTLSISGNDNLINLDGLLNLHSSGSVIINSNDLLENVKWIIEPNFGYHIKYFFKRKSDEYRWFIKYRHSSWRIIDWLQ